MDLAAICSPVAPAPFCEDLAPPIDDMILEIPAYSKTDVKKAGSFLSRTIPIFSCPEDAEEAAKWFRIAHNWRSSHILPMRHVRFELERKARIHGGFTAARLKRMQSIRKKLPNRQLNQIQDIAGCRIVCPSMVSLKRVLEEYNAGDTRHSVVNQNDYISAPKGSGYRSHHLVVKFGSTEKTKAYEGLKVELQLRTRLQHAWATAIEAVGLYTNEDLKGGRGDARWLRFFQLMASEAALSESAPVVGGVPEETRVRRAEIQHLNDDLDAIATLEAFRQAVKDTDDLRSTIARHYMIQFDHATKRVTVTPYHEMSAGSRDYDRNDLDAMPTNAVLVEVERVEDLKSAFPNYFLDVALFAGGLKRVLNGEDFRIAEEGAAPEIKSAGHSSSLAALSDYARSRLSRR